MRSHNLSPLGICEACESAPEYRLTYCPGYPLTAYQKGRVSRGRLDFVAGGWEEKITLPRFVGSFDEVTAFLQADLGGFK